MQSKTTKTIFYISTGLLTLLMLFSASMYFVNTEGVAAEFTKLGFPTYIIYPLAIAKLLGLIAIWFIKNPSLKEWAYAGFFFNILLAFSAHLIMNDGDQMGAVLALAFLVISYTSYKKINP